jgi:hypothetical protein
MGKFTSSNISDLLTYPERESLPPGAITYCMEAVSEMLTEGTMDITTPAMRWGTEQEPNAIEALKVKHPNIIHYGKTFFPLTKLSGGSPDAEVIEPRRLVFEVKCPESPSNHIKHCLLKDQAQFKKEYFKYYCQLQMNMLIMAARYNVAINEVGGVFASFHPMFKGNPDYSLFELELEPDIELHALIKKRIELAEKEVVRILKLLNVQFGY